jgi:hypothetical protein
LQNIDFGVFLQILFVFFLPVFLIFILPCIIFVRCRQQSSNGNVVKIVNSNSKHDDEEDDENDAEEEEPLTEKIVGPAGLSKSPAHFKPGKDGSGQNNAKRSSENNMVIT